MITFERATLYEEVWAEPVTIVSKRYGLSDTGLRKICKKLGVPLPPLGYWSRLRAGQRVARTPLRKHSGPDSVIADPSAHSFRERSSPALRALEKAARIDELEKAARFTVDTQAPFRTKLVKRLEKRLRDIDKNWEKSERLSGPARLNMDRIGERMPGGLIEPGFEFLSVVVTPELRPRALAIADLFLSEVTNRRFQLRIEDGKTIIKQLDIEVIFRMSEVTEKTGNVVYFGDRQRATGALRITIRAAHYHVAGVPQSMVIRDEPGRPIERQLGSVIYRLRQALLGHSEREETRREDARLAAEERVRAAERARLAALAAEAARQEKARVDEFIAEADKWDVVSRRLAYIDHVEADARARGLPVDTDSTIGQWIAWARAVCFAEDPTGQRIKNLLLKE